MASNTPKAGFALPQRPTKPPSSVEEFVAGAGQPAHAQPVSASSRLPWEGEDDQRAVPFQPLRLTAKQSAALEFVMANRPGYRSKHAALVMLVNDGLRRAIKELTGEDIEFASDPQPK